jgi:hypothetical protein
MTIDKEKINQWLEWKKGFHDDKEYSDYAKGVRKNQQNVIEEIRTFLNNFLNNSISLEEFRSTFHLKTSKDWDYFGMKGMNGAMVLNKYVKHIPDKQDLTNQLRKALNCPNTREEGQKKMEELYAFLESMIQKYNLKRFDVQPGRIPYFVSGFWHFQNPEKWPFYYQLTRQIFEQNGTYEPQSNPIEDYFNFHSIYSELKSLLEIDSFELDYLCGWISHDPYKKRTPIQTTPMKEIEPENSVEDIEPTDIEHIHIQWMLAKIGRKMGFNIWIASNDRSKQWKNESLGSLCIQELPSLGLGDDAQKIIKFIDVIWLKGLKQIVAAFEVEKSTQIYSGLLRMSDLVVEAPNTIFPIYIIAPENRIKEIERQLFRPTFLNLGLTDRCGYFSDRSLMDNYDHIMKFASDLSAIEALATRMHIV